MSIRTITAPAALPWAATLASAIVSIVVLHGLAGDTAATIEWGNLWVWLGDHEPERVLLAFTRWLALMLAYWVAASLVAYPLAKASRIPTLIRSVEWLTLPAIRRLADRAVAVSLAVSTLSAGGIGAAVAAQTPTHEHYAVPVVHLDQAEPSPTGYIPVPAGDLPEVPAPSSEETDASFVPTPAGERARPIATTAPEHTLRFDPAAADTAPVAAEGRLATEAYEYDIAPGDNLWLVAERHLADVLQRSPSDAETATYWAHLVRTNQPRLRSGDPDLIYPGEIVTCPAATDVGLGTG